MARYGVFSCSCTSFSHYHYGWLFILTLLFQVAAPTNSSATFGTFRGLILRSQLIILLKQKVSVCRNFIVICLSSVLVQDTSLSQSMSSHKCMNDADEFNAGGG